MKQRLLLATLVVLIGTILLVNFVGMDWLPGRAIHIGVRPLAGIPAGGVEPLVFLLDRQCQLTGVKVVVASEARTNRYPHAVWELVSETNSAPLTHFIYGGAIAGMKPPYTNVPPERLDPNTAYRVIVQCGKIRAEREFTCTRAGGR